ncbi:MAG: carboxypeptidase regulatory-like domain-containing protein [Prevotellaceae bacterium]|jgi:hypothetical protein|nr:carboxypeptidase regulatory-like domain-containing protein [Prevotellaceae bacterium]
MKKNFLAVFIICVCSINCFAQKQEHRFILNQRSDSKERTTLSMPAAETVAQRDGSLRHLSPSAAGDIDEVFDGATFPPADWTLTNSSNSGNWYAWESSASILLKYTNNTPQRGTADVIRVTGDGSHAVFNPFIAPGDWSRLETPVITPNADRKLLTFDLYEICMSTSWLGAGFQLYADIYTDGAWVDGTTNILLDMTGHNTGPQYAVHTLSTSIDLSAYIGQSIKVGFRAISDDGGITLLLDNVRFATLTPAPSFNGASSINLGSGKDLYTHFAAQYEIRNYGGGELVVTQQSPVDGITIEGLPLTVIAGEVKTATVKLAAEGLDGIIEKDIILSTNDPLQSEVTVTAYANVMAVKVRKYISENFNLHTYFPKGWQDFSHNVEVLPNVGVDGTNALKGSIFYDESMLFMSEAAVVPPLVKIDNNSVFKLKYKALKTGTEVGASTDVYSVDVYYATMPEVRAAFSQPDPVLQGHYLTTISQSVTNDFVEYSMPAANLSQLYGDTVLFNIVTETLTAGNFIDIFIDDIKIGTPRSNDLEFADMSGSALGVANKAMSFKAEISNLGENAVDAADYAAELISGSVSIATARSASIASGESVISALNYTPTAEGVVPAQINVAYAQDEDLANNISKDFNMKIFPETTTLFEAAGDSEKNIHEPYAPMYLWFKNSVTQTIYNPNDIGSNAATIKGVAYQFSFDNPVSEIPVEMWIGTTEYADYSSGSHWIDTTALTKVFSGQNTIEDRYNDRLYIPFNQDYNYNGGNLVLYVLRRGGHNYTLSEKFAATSMPARTLLFFHEISAQFSLDPAYLAENGYIEDFIPNTTFITEVNAGSLSGVITDANGALEGAKVELVDENMYTFTDADGKYRFPYLAGKSYSVKVTKRHYNDAVATIDIVAQQEGILNIQLDEEANSHLTYSITDSYTQQPIPNASVRLEGSDKYAGTTDANGVCSFEKVYNGAYSLHVLATDYYPFSADANIAGSIESTIPLSEKFYVSGAVTATKTGTEENPVVNVSWSEPKVFTEFRYDNGEQSGILGSMEGTVDGVMGCAYPKQSEINSVSWYTSKKTYGNHNFVNVFIFALDNGGLPTKDILYSQLDVPNTDDVWNTLYLPQLISAPNGFLVALSYSYGHLSIGTTLPDANYPFAPAQYYAKNYNETEFIPIGDDGFNVNMMIRATVTDLGASAQRTSAPATIAAETAVSPTLTNYSVFRLLVGASKSEWTQIAQSDATSCTDNEFKTQAQGTYQYAVVTNYCDGTQESNAAFSNPVVQTATGEADRTMQQNGINVYPNPAKGLIYVQTPETATVTVSDMTGRILEQRTVDAGSAAFDLKAAGAYFIKIDGEKKSSVFKVINK